MDEIPTREIRTIRIGNHEFRTYNLTINDGSTRKTLVFMFSPLGFSSNTRSNKSPYLGFNGLMKVSYVPLNLKHICLEPAPERAPET